MTTVETVLVVLLFCVFVTWLIGVSERLFKSPLTDQQKRAFGKHLPKHLQGD